MGVDQAQHAERRDALVGRLFEATLGTFDLFTVYLGDRLGLYRALAASGSMTSSDLAVQTGMNERYVHERLEQQATTGFIEVAVSSGEPSKRRYRLPPGHAEVLLDGDSLSFFAPFVRLVVGATRPLPAILDAFRTGGGVPYADYGVDAREGIAESNRPMFINLLGTAWLPAIPDVHARLGADPAARVADVGCGSGWSSIAIARAYPGVRVDGFDVDPASIELARANAAAAGLADRVRFTVVDAGGPGLSGRYDLVTAFETIHDMARPIEALANLRGMVGKDGAVVIADERVGDTFGAIGDPTERFMYGFSVLHCLHVGMAESPSAGTGAVLRPPMLRRYALAAGFRDVEILPIENDFWRFYRLLV